MKAVEDAADLIALDRARRDDAGKPNIPFNEMMRQLGMRPRRKPKRKTSRRLARKRR